MTSSQTKIDEHCLSRISRIVLAYCLMRRGRVIQTKIIAGVLGESMQSVVEACEELVNANFLVKEGSEDTSIIQVSLEHKNVAQARALIDKAEHLENN